MKDSSATGRRSANAAWIWAALIVLSGSTVLVATRVNGLLNAETIVLGLISSAYAALGLLIVLRRPGNRVAWLLFVIATWLVGSGATNLRLPDRTVPPDPVAVWDVLVLVWENGGYVVGLFIPLFLFLYIFPTGRFLSRRWLWAGRLGAILTSGGFFKELFSTEVGPTDGDWKIANPIGFLGSDPVVVDVLITLGLLTLVFGGILAIIARYRSSDAPVRLQIKWVVYALLITVGGFIANIFASALIPQLPDWVSTFIFLTLLMAIPSSVTIAIARYRLYDIDRLISRTLGYVLIVATLGSVYAAGAIWLPTQLPGDQPPIFVAASTLAVAALFTPVRRIILDRVDRRFNRVGYESGIILNDFAADLRNATDIDELAENSLDVVRRAMQPASAGIWIRTPEQETDRR